MSTAWDDDWESAANKPAARNPEPSRPKKLSQSERRALHAQQQKQLWEAAENPEPEPLFIAARNNAPLPNEFKAPLKLLSRKPPPKVATRQGPNLQMGDLNLNDDDDSEEEERKKAEAAFKERQVRAQKEREEKQRLYNERRAELLGTPAPQQGRSSPQKNTRGKGKGRGQRSGDSTPPSGDQAPARNSNQRAKQQLYEPSYSPKPNSVYIQKRAEEAERGTPDASKEHQPIRAPRNPDGSGRGGFGFSPRGNKTGSAV